jgi:hypothetical protein
MANPIVISGDWYDSETAARELGVTVRTLQKWAHRGHLEFKTVRQDRRRTRLYTAESVQKFRDSGPREPRRPAETGAVVAIRPPKLSQGERALDTVSIVGNLVAGHKAEMEMLVAQSARNLETVVNLILNAQKAEADANRERLKAEREDARERWEIDRQDRLERRKDRLAIPTPAEKLKAKKAHA